MGLPELTADVAERCRRAGAWQERTFHELIDGVAAEDPAKEAVCDQHRRLSYADLVSESNALAQLLIDAGIAEGECVAIQSGNRIELAVAHVACSRAGATFVPMSDAWRATELRHILGAARAPVAIVPASGDHDYLAEVRELQQELPALRLVASADGGGDVDLPEVLARDAGHVGRPGDPDAPRYVMVSSGTTSMPKLALWTDNNLWWFGELYARAVALSFRDRVVGLAPIGTGAVGYVFGVLFPLLKGATSILLERWSPASALELLAGERASIATAVPTQIAKLLQEPDAGARPLPALRVMTNGGAPMAPEVAKSVERAWGCRVQTIYGATDGGVPLMTRIDDPASKRRQTVGRVTPFTEVRLVDEAMADVAPGEAGELLWRGPTKTFGYLGDPQRTAEAFWGDGWYRSGDLAQADADGYHRIVGRAKDMIIRGGQNISPREIEEAIALHPAVGEVAAVGVPDPVYGERVCVAVTLRGAATLDLDELVAFLADRRLARFKLPELLEIFDDLPKNAAGKVSKDDVRRLVFSAPPRRRSARSSGP